MTFLGESIILKANCPSDLTLPISINERIKMDYRIFHRPLGPPKKLKNIHGKTDLFNMGGVNLSTV